MSKIYEEKNGENEIIIRTAALDDAKVLLDIYRPYVEKTAITFEYDVPAVEVFRSRIEKTLKKYPYLVAEINGEVTGYVYASTFKGRAAYDWAVETSVYIKEDMRKMGLGKLLYAQLEKILKKQNIVNLYACIAYTEVEDEYLTNASVKFHKHMGYEWIGEFHKCGYKFNRWYDMVWLEKILGEHTDNQPAVIKFEDLEI
ncbi:gCN5-related N-acetyltransferase [Eubacterium sp. CAG:603]|nr:gCN5-related N-acetyltransferase [Eubacterium sp. CAG:603]